MKPLVVSALALGGMTLSPAAAQEPGSRQTREFVQAAAQSDAFEIAEAESALAQSRDPQVLAFAKAMIHDHEESSRALRQAAATAGLAPPPMAVGAGQAPFLADLQSQHADTFDRTYWHHQALAHRSALTTTQLYAETGDTPAIRQAATATVPVIQSHLAMAEQMEAKAGG